MRVFFVAALSVLLSTGAWAQEAPEPSHHPAGGPQGGGEQVAQHGGAGEKAEAHGGEQTCEQILADHGGGHEGQPDVAEEIFHHVTDSHVIEFESPIPIGGHVSAVHIDFKRVVCSAFGWNGVVHLGQNAVDLTPTKHAFFMWVAALLLIAMFWSTAPKKGQLVPRGMGALLEIVVVFIRDEIARKNIPDAKEADRYTPYLLSAFFFIFIMNLLGLIPFTATATGNIGVTLGLALMTFTLTQVAGIRAAGLGGYLKHLTGGVHWSLWAIMVPVEFLGLFTKPFALTIRLFANMLAGHIVIYFLLGLIFIMKTIWLAPVSVAFAFGIYLLELFVALVQAYVFTMLSALFIGFGVAMGHHAHGDDASGAHGETHGEHVVHH